MKTNRFCAVLLLAATASVISGCVEHRTVYVPVSQPPPPPVVQTAPVVRPPPPVVAAPPAPPAAPVEVVPARPGPHYVWTPGYWAWQGRWVWVRGAWVVPPRPRAVWVGGHWERHGRGQVWIGGHWR